MAGDLAHRYLWGPAVDQLLADERVESLTNVALNETLFPLADHLGSVRDVVDSSGTLRLHREFDSYGNIVSQTHYDADGLVVSEGEPGYATIAFGYTGKLFEIHTGLQYNLNRWYDPGTGRWLSEDPIRDGTNWNVYVGNQPTTYVDPDGLEAQPAGTGGVGSSGWNPWNLPGIYHIAVWPWTVGIKQRTVEIEDNIRRRQQENALANPQCADPEAVRPYASDAEIGLMQDYVETGIHLNVTLGAAQLGATTGLRLPPRGTPERAVIEAARRRGIAAAESPRTCTYSCWR